MIDKLLNVAILSPEASYNCIGVVDVSHGDYYLVAVIDTGSVWQPPKFPSHSVSSNMKMNMLYRMEFSSKGDLHTDTDLRFGWFTTPILTNNSSSNVYIIVLQQPK